ncbi:hypothetical protein [Arthrobacter sp. NicSoilB8]|uniref:hypothetical protein n=1 Tax=Arthrobacter sp. NicSoilB8 TaxID=2830998 RepID=UPI001CC49ECC|nr:hypothetical protein [Arthrobacter sp. NicSoilB8]BCW70734.1 hypothetical protein NicSoilB8_17780 [Arthrobacter sp. NicSoilB8]
MRLLLIFAVVGGCSYGSAIRGASFCMIGGEVFSRDDLANERGAAFLAGALCIEHGSYVREDQGAHASFGR